MPKYPTGLMPCLECFDLDTCQMKDDYSLFEDNASILPIITKTRGFTKDSFDYKGTVHIHGQEVFWSYRYAILTYEKDGNFYGCLCGIRDTYEYIGSQINITGYRTLLDSCISPAISAIICT